MLRGYPIDYLVLALSLKPSKIERLPGRVVPVPPIFVVGGAKAMSETQDSIAAIELTIAHRFLESLAEVMTEGRGLSESGYSLDTVQRITEIISSLLAVPYQSASEDETWLSFRQRCHDGDVNDVMSYLHQVLAANGVTSRCSACHTRLGCRFGRVRLGQL